VRARRTAIVRIPEVLTCRGSGSRNDVDKVLALGYIWFADASSVAIWGVKGVEVTRVKGFGLKILLKEQVEI
jgi:hypothetical protein